eukprot:jgi/Chlat1/8095/Chrsp75S07591
MEEAERPSTSASLSSSAAGGGLRVRETTEAVLGWDDGGRKTVNQYVKVKKLSSGAFAKVGLYRSRADGCLYALKILSKPQLRRRYSFGTSALQDVMREVTIMKRLDHPNIVKLYEVIDDPHEDRLYMADSMLLLVLEYVSGGCVLKDVSGLTGQGGTGREISSLSEPLARKYMRDVVRGLDYVHSRGVVHGDLKPENLLLSEDGCVKIGDFGVSQLFIDGDDRCLRSPGTPMYTAPECCTGEVYSGVLADVWALGVCLYVMIHGRLPFTGSSTMSAYQHIFLQPLELDSNMSPELADMLTGMLSKDPSERVHVSKLKQHPWLLSNG